MLIGELFGLARRLLRWKHGRPVDGAGASGRDPSEPGHSAHRRN
jgi:hypothetical protein